MTNSEKFCLRWNDFETNISAAFRELRDDKDFFDVTLACDDSQLQAHKVILSACSPFFRNILRKNPHQHPLLYLKGVKFKELVSVLNFMYMGEVNVAQDELNSFLSVAEELNVKGLTQNNSSDTAKPDKFKSNNNRFGDPSERDLSSAPPSKKIRPASISGTVPISNVSPAQHTVVPGQDDIQEVVPVKSEPRDSSTVPSTQQPVVLSREDSKQNYQHLETSGGQQQGTVALQDNYQEDGYEYEGYEGYDDGSYDQTTGQPGRADGNKGRNSRCKSVNLPMPPRLRPEAAVDILIKEELQPELCADMNMTEMENDDAAEDSASCDIRWDIEVESRISLDLNLFVCMACSGSKYSSKQKLNVISHIRSKHLTNFAGFLCELCPKVFNSSNRFERHMKISHNVLTVSTDIIKTEDSIAE